jgi:hypothetical protein
MVRKLRSKIGSNFQDLRHAAKLCLCSKLAVLGEKLDSRGVEAEHCVAIFAFQATDLIFIVVNWYRG